MTQADEILSFLKEGAETALSELYEALDYPRASIRRAVYSLIDRGTIERVYKGVFKLTGKMYQIAIAIRFVDHGDYYFITCYYTTRDTKTLDKREARKRIREEWSALTGYKDTENWYEGCLILSDWEEVEDGEEGVYRVEEE